MRNPWTELPNRRPYVLAEDAAVIERHNLRASPTHRVNTNTLPEPFIGDVQCGTVVLLNQNPGNDPADEPAHANPVFRAAILRNIRHDQQEYPFYYLSTDPNIANAPGADWWRKHLKELFSVAGLKSAVVASKLCVIEWFPYHTTKGAAMNCPSQTYSFDLARSALDSGKYVVGMRAKGLWSKVDARFAEIPYLHSCQNICVTRRNAGPKVFEEIIDRLNG